MSRASPPPRSASVAGFTVDDNDDLRIAVDELVVMSIEGGVRRRRDDAVLGLGPRGARRDRDAAAADLASNPERFMLSEQILGVVTDWYAVTATDGVLTAAFTKSAS